MILKLKKGKSEDVIQTIDGGVRFEEGVETVIDYSRILKEEIDRVHKDYDIIDERGFLKTEKVKAEKPVKPEKTEKVKAEKPVKPEKTEKVKAENEVE